MKKQITVWILIAAMLAGILTGCAGSANTNDSGTPSADAASAAADTTAAAKYAFRADYLPISAEFESCSSSCVSGNMMYLIADCYQEDTENNLYGYMPTLMRIDLTTGEAEKLPWYTQPEIPEGYQGDFYIDYMCVTGDGTLWLSESGSTYTFDLPEDFDPMTGNEYDYYQQGESSGRILHFGADGTLLDEFPKPEIDGVDAMNLSLTVIDEKGHLYLTDYENIYVADGSGKVLKTISCENASLVSFCGQAAIQSWGAIPSFCVVDPEMLEPGSSLKVPVNGWNFMQSYDDAFDFYYDNSGDIYGFHQATGESEKVVSWLDCDVDPGDVSTTFPLEDGRFCTLLAHWDEDAWKTSFELVTLTPVDPSTLPQKTVLRLACMYLDFNQRDKILEFNKTHDDVRITVEDYSQYATEDDYEAGLTKLNTEILAGKTPDLMLTAQMPIDQYGAKGYLEDLLPYIDNDPELSREDLMDNVLQAVCTGDKLYQAFSAFLIKSAAVSERIAASFDMWTIADVYEAMPMLREDATIFGTGYTRDAILYNFVGNALNRFVDWNTGKCDFDNDEFKGLLEFANSFPETFDWDNYDWNDYVDPNEAIINGSQLMTDVSIYGLEDFLYLLASTKDSAAFVGYPSQTGEGSYFLINTGICIFSTCQDKDAAWEFVRTLFTEDYQMNSDMWSGLPSNKNVFNKRIEDMMTEEYETDENGEPVLDENGEKIVIPKTTFGSEDGEIVITAMTAEQRDRLMELYDSIHTAYSTNEMIYNIVLEEAGAYFAGQKTLDEVAPLIENRVGLYVAEQK